MADMIKFYKGLEASLPATGDNGALYITTDEGGIYLGTGTGMKRLGDFVQVANVEALPEKAHENCLYYCVAENILAKWNGTEWKQINKQPTSEELKVLLGLGSLAYLSEVAEDNLATALKEKVNAAAEGNHAHLNKTELDKIADGDVAKWNAAEQNAKDYADGLNTTMDGRVDALETAIGEGGSVSTQIKTAIEALDFTDAAVDGEYVSAVNEVDGKISVSRKALPDYSNTYDAKGAAATAESNAKAYADGLAGNYDEKGAAAGVKTELEAEIAKKVNIVEGKSLVDDTEITKLAGVSAGANKVEASENGKIKIDGVDTVVYTHPDKHAIADVDGLQAALDGKQAAGDYAVEGHTHTKSEITDFAHTHIASEITNLDATIKGYDYATKTEAQGYVDTYKTANDKALADEVKAREDADIAINNKIGEVTEGKTVVEMIADAKTEATYDDTQIKADIKANADAIDAIEEDYLTSEDKTELEGKITANANAIELLTNGVSAEEVDGVNDLIQYVKNHGTEVTGIKADIAANTKAIEDHEALAAETYETKDDADDKLAEAKEYADDINTALDARLDVLEAINHDAYIAADSALKTELQKEIDNDVKALADTVYTKTEVEALLTWGSFESNN